MTTFEAAAAKYSALLEHAPVLLVNSKAVPWGRHDLVRFLDHVPPSNCPGNAGIFQVDPDGQHRPDERRVHLTTTWSTWAGRQPLSLILASFNARRERQPEPSGRSTELDIDNSNWECYCGSHGDR